MTIEFLFKNSIIIFLYYFSGIIYINRFIKPSLYKSIIKMKGGSPYMSYGGEGESQKYDCTMQQVIIVIAVMYFLYMYIIKPKTGECFRDGSVYDQPYRTSGGQQYTTPYTGSTYGSYWNKIINKISKK
jgi:hypothetical protein